MYANLKGKFSPPPVGIALGYKGNWKNLIYHRDTEVFWRLFFKGNGSKAAQRPLRTTSYDLYRDDYGKGLVSLTKNNNFLCYSHSGKR